MLMFSGGYDILLYIAAVVLMMGAQAKVRSAYNRFSQMRASTSYTGYDVAKLIMQRQGVLDVQIEQAKGTLSDHYDPKAKVVRLSKGVYDSNSIAAISIAAHEVGHVIQHQQGYAFLALRNSILPAALVAGNLGWGVLIAGLIFSSTGLLYVGIGMLGIIALFQLVTLPVEFDASHRALVFLVDEGIVSLDERPYAKSMLSAAALTYVAALAGTLLQILRFALLANRRR
jgi:Zn-dependent membrane protease YugP